MIMRVILVAILWTVVTASSYGAPDSLFFEGNKLYEEGNYEEAIEYYDRVMAEGYESPALYYNAGNAYYRSNKLGKARLYYEKALKLDPQDEDIKANLAYLQNFLVDKFNDIPVFFLKRWEQKLFSSLGTNRWAIISMVTFVLTLAAFSLYLLIKRSGVRKAGFFSGLILILVSVMGFFISMKQRKEIISPDEAIVTTVSVNVRSAPRETGTELFILHEGAKVWMEDNAGDWREIRLSDGRKGWLPENSVEVI